MEPDKKLTYLALSENGFLFDTTTGHTYSLNPSGTFILKRLIKGIPLEDIKAAMAETYDTTEEVITRDLNQFMLFLTELGITNRPD